MRTGVPCNENRFYPVRISTQGKLCSAPVLVLYGIAVSLTLLGLGLIKINYVSANFINPRPSLILNN